MPDLEDGSTETDAFPETPLSGDELSAALEARLAEVPGWHSPDDPVRLGFAMTAPHRLALDAFGRFAERNPNNVGVHTRFGDGVRGTRRLEREAVLALAGLLHADAADGYLTGGANEGTLAALRIGRNALRAAGAGRVVVLASALTHHSVAKAAEILDLELRLCPAGPSWLLEAATVEAELDALAARTEPGTRTGVVVVSTAGYYNTGLVDPVDAIAGVLARRAADGGRLGVFHHVDAAHGGMILPFTAPEVPFDFRNAYVHSVVLDPHKSGLMPYSCGVFLCRKGLLGHGAVPAPMSGFVDETITGSRSGAMAAALWSLVFGLAADGYRKVFRDCLDVRDRLAEAVRAADPEAVVLPSPGNTVVVAGFSHEGGRLPRELAERYRLVGNNLPWRAPDGRVRDRLFHHLYAMPHLTRAHVDGFASALTAALSAAPAGGGGFAVPARSRASERDSAASDGASDAGSDAGSALRDVRRSSVCLRHLVVHPPGMRDPDDHPHAYSFHTFQDRARLGEELTVRPWTGDGDGAGRFVYAPDLDAPFANELFGVTDPERYALEVLDRNQQKLSLVGAAHFAVFGPEPRTPRRPVVLANFHADGAFRSVEYKYGDRRHNDEVQVFGDRIVVKAGKDARGVRREGDDWSFSLDTSLELRVALTDDGAAPRITRVARHADPALPRRRHLLRGQYRRFPNRFFDTVVEMTVGREHTGTARFDEPLLARSAALDLARVVPSVADGVLRVELAAVDGPGTVVLAVPLGLGVRLTELLPGIPVGEPEALSPAEVVRWAARLYPPVGALREAATDRAGLRRFTAPGLSVPGITADRREPC
ncbi:pyridoxal-dependent decarboxylase [Streptomyces rochei]|uniref:pyridoxal-dependent decarboxylase n=1 Tax=Streptomyces rochei TaxID=1928 RepID=UPI002ACD4129|nr:pyridoxal-dependent decarboxylase [Streptomyces rochei]WQC15567.1 pyridoxal-dependent decarboxylase [Streptomyces rochei]